MTCNVAFIGLGVMGYPMAGYISKAGHNVTVFNRTKSKAEKWIGEYKGKMANTPAEAAASAGVLAILPLYSPIHFSALDLVLLKTVTLCPAFDIYPAIG